MGVTSVQLASCVVLVASSKDRSTCRFRELFIGPVNDFALNTCSPSSSLNSASLPRSRPLKSTCLIVGYSQLSNTEISLANATGSAGLGASSKSASGAREDGARPSSRAISNCRSSTVAGRRAGSRWVATVTTSRQGPSSGISGIFICGCRLVTAHPMICPML